jgi:ABC-2 type transport system permease protein
MRVIVKYLAISWASVKSNMAYAGEVGGRMFFLAVILYIFMRLWQSTYEHSPATRFGGLTLNDMIWYLTLTEAILMSGPRLSQRIDEEVRTGSLCVQLTRPVSYPMYWLFTNIGERTVRFALTLLAGAIMSWLLVGPPRNLLGQLSFALLALPLAFVIDFLGNFLVGLCAFWLEDTNGLSLVYSRLTAILGGMLIPLQLLPDWLSRPLGALPFASIIYAPANLFVHPSWQTLALSLVQQCLWVAVFASVVWLVYRKALARVASHGG